MGEPKQQTLIFEHHCNHTLGIWAQNGVLKKQFPQSNGSMLYIGIHKWA
jgi:hypothetical protein